MFKDFVSLLSGFRKFSIMMLLIVVGVVFRIVGWISGEEMVDLLSSTAVAFMSFNGIEHVSKAVQEWVKSKAGVVNE